MNTSSYIKKCIHGDYREIIGNIANTMRNRFETQGTRLVRYGQSGLHSLLDVRPSLTPPPKHIGKRALNHLPISTQHFDSCVLTDKKKRKSKRYILNAMTQESRIYLVTLSI